MARLPAPCRALVMCRGHEFGPPRFPRISWRYALRTARSSASPVSAGERHRANWGESPRPGGPLAAPGISYRFCRNERVT